MRLAILLATLFFAQQTWAAPIVIPDSVQFFTGQDGLGNASHQLMVFQETTLRDVTSFYFGHQFDQLTSIPTIQAENVNLDEASDWYLVRKGDFFTPDAIASGNLIRLAEVRRTYLFEDVIVDPTYWSNWPYYPFLDPAPLPNWSTSFYLAFATSRGWKDTDGATIPNDRNIFGWVELQFEAYPFPSPSWPPNQLQLLGSATAFDSGGIVIGSLQAVPEPSSLLIGVIGLLSCGCRRRAAYRFNKIA